MLVPKEVALNRLLLAEANWMVLVIPIKLVIIHSLRANASANLNSNYICSLTSFLNLLCLNNPQGNFGSSKEPKRALCNHEWVPDTILSPKKTLKEWKGHQNNPRTQDRLELFPFTHLFRLILFLL